MSINLTRNAYWLAPVLFFAAVYSLFLGVSYPMWHKYERLKHVGVQTVGIVVSKERFNHESISYTFTIGSITYSGSSAARVVAPRFEMINIGDQVSVTYLSENPKISVAGDPAGMYASWCGLVFIFAPIVCLIVSLPLGVICWVLTKSLPARARREKEKAGEVR